MSSGYEDGIQKMDRNSFLSTLLADLRVCTKELEEGQYQERAGNARKATHLYMWVGSRLERVLDGVKEVLKGEIV